MIRKEIADQLVVDNKTSVIPTGKDRLLGRRSDAVDPTLTFSAEEMSVAQASHSQGVFRRGHFDSVTKKYLLLPPDRDKVLTGNIETDDLFKRFEHQNKFEHIF